MRRFLPSDAPSRWLRPVLLSWLGLAAGAGAGAGGCARGGAASESSVASTSSQRSPPGDGAATPEAAPSVPPRVLELEAEISDDPGAAAPRYVLARFYAGRSDEERALRLLAELVAIEGWDYQLAADDFPTLVDDPRFQRLAERARAAGPEVRRSELAFELDGLDLLPEGIAWDARRERLVVGSMRQRRVYTADAEGKLQPLTEPAQDGLAGVLGVEVAPEGGAVFVVSAGFPLMQDFDPERDGDRSSVYAFDLETGATLGRWPTPTHPSQLNDLVVLSDGRFFATDSVSGQLMMGRRDDPSGTELVPFLPGQSFFAANGIAALEGETALVVADFRGLHRVDLASASVEALEPPPGVLTLSGIDGLDRRGDRLVAIQNLFGPGRVWLLGLDAEGRRLSSSEILEDAHPRMKGPTTGAIAGTRYLYLANAALQFENNAMVDAPAGARHAILSLPLP